MTTPPPSSSPEVIFLRPPNDLERVVVTWQALLVEAGAFFAYEDPFTLPDRLPADLAGVRMVLIDDASWDARWGGPDGARLEEFRRGGGIVYRMKTTLRPNEEPCRSTFEMMMAQSGATRNHPAMRARLRARSFDQATLEMWPGILRFYDSEPDVSPDHWGEPLTFNKLQPMELWHRLRPELGLDRRLREHLDRLLEIGHGEDTSLDQISAMEVFIRMTQRTGDGRYLELARRALERVLARPRTFEGVPLLRVDRDGLLWNEVCSMFCPSAALLGRVTGDARFLDTAVRTAELLHELVYDPEICLWYHAGRRGWHTPAVWSRGQGWALIGLTGLVRNLPEDHPKRPVILGYMREILDGLLATQDDEGLWHNVVDNPVSRTELSGTSMFVWCYCEALREGWIDAPRLEPMLRRAWAGLIGRCWKTRVYSACTATGASASYQFYLARPQRGSTQRFLHAAAEYLLTFGNPQP